MSALPELLRRYREPAAYIVCGVITTAVNYAVYAACTVLLGLGINLSNILAWAGAVVIAFVLNKLFVFQKGGWSPAEVLREGVLFVGGRLFSGAVSVGLVPVLLWLGVTWTLLGIPGFFAKLLAEIIGMILNYFLSKYAVFKK